MGNVTSKDGVPGDGAEDGIGFTGDGVLVSEEARVKGALNGSSALHSVADMIAHGPFPPPNTNVVSRYQQISGQAGRASENQEWPFLDRARMHAGVMESSSSSSAALSLKSSATTSQATLWAEDELGQSWMHPTQNNEEFRLRSRVATLIEWKHGGSDVLLEGSWDDWHTRVPLQRAGKDFVILKFLPEGVYHYKFVVDGEWKHAPELPCMFDEKGNGINILDVQNCAPEDLDGIVDFKAPESPKSSYDSPFPGPEDYSKDPPLLPSQLHHNNELERAYQHSISTSITGSSISSTRPQHVVLNHLFVETRKSASSGVLTLGFTQRFRSKYTTVILHKPVRRRG